MMKRLIGLMVLAAMFAACGSNNNNGNATGSEASVADVTFASVVENPAQYLNKEISVEGKVVHVCMHSGKKMFIVGENPDIRLFISAGEEVPKFPTELLGSEIKVTGVLAKVEAGSGMGEGEGKGEAMAEGETSGELCETEAAVAAQPVLAEFVLNYKEHSVK